MISAPSDIRCISMLDEPHDRKDNRQRERYGERDDQAGSNTETDEAHHHDDGDRLYQRDHELADGLVDHDGLVRNQAGLNSDREDPP